MRRAFSLLAAVTAIATALLTTGCTAGGAGNATGAALGKVIYNSGQGHSGTIPRSMMDGAYQTEGLPCAACHGPQGQGTGIGPSITRATLGTQHTITHKPSATDPQPQPVTEGPWTTAQTVEAVRTGVTPEGHHLGGRMPRWQLDSQDASALAEYLGGL